MKSFKLKRSSVSSEHFEPLTIGAMKVSIQASAFHYCSPRRTLPSSDDYQEFEVALMKGDDWYHPELDDKFAHTSWAKYWSSHDDVAGGVPREEIVQMLTDLNSAFNN